MVSRQLTCNTRSLTFVLSSLEVLGLHQVDCVARTTYIEAVSAIAHQLSVLCIGVEIFTGGRQDIYIALHNRTEGILEENEVLRGVTQQILPHACNVRALWIDDRVVPLASIFNMRRLEEFHLSVVFNEDGTAPLEPVFAQKERLPSTLRHLVIVHERISIPDPSQALREMPRTAGIDYSIKQGRDPAAFMRRHLMAMDLP